MVDVIQNNQSTTLVLTPNRSMSWQANKRILLAMFVVNMVIALSWSAMGAWMVLPFAGLEIMLVGIGMYYVSWKLSFQEVITIEAESFTLQKGVYFPKQEWNWQRSNTALLKVKSRYRMSAPTLFLQHLNDRIEIGDFLNLSEKKQLQKQLSELLIPIKSVGQ